MATSMVSLISILFCNVVLEPSRAQDLCVSYLWSNLTPSCYNTFCHFSSNRWWIPSHNTHRIGLVPGRQQFKFFSLLFNRLYFSMTTRNPCGMIPSNQFRTRIIHFSSSFWRLQSSPIATNLQSWSCTTIWGEVSCPDTSNHSMQPNTLGNSEEILSSALADPFNIFVIFQDR
jgi:hypothetical protein